MEAINVYRKAIKRTFADVYQVLPETIDVSWGDDTIAVRCSDHNFTHKIDRDDATTLEFISDSEDPVTITLTDDERRRIEQAPIISAHVGVTAKPFLRIIGALDRFPVVSAYERQN